MSSIDSLWYTLLRFWCLKQIPLGHGLTIPFLLGAEKYFGGRELSISQLFDEMINYPRIEGQFFTIKYCDQIDEIIIGIDELTDLELKYYRDLKGIILLHDDQEFQNHEDLLKYLTKKYFPTITSNEFSKTQGKWSEFHDDDIAWIKKFA
jgi:hypothetical protein